MGQSDHRKVSEKNTNPIQHNTTKHTEHINADTSLYEKTVKSSQTASNILQGATQITGEKNNSDYYDYYKKGQTKAKDRQTP